MRNYLVQVINSVKNRFDHVAAQELSLVALTGTQSEPVTISATSAESSAILTSTVVVTPSVDCFFRQGTDGANTALSDGTDQILLAFNSYRITGVVSGNTLAFKTTGASGTVYVTPGA